MCHSAFFFSVAFSRPFPLFNPWDFRWSFNAAHQYARHALKSRQKFENIWPSTCPGSSLRLIKPRRKYLWKTQNFCKTQKIIFIVGPKVEQRKRITFNCQIKNTFWHRFLSNKIACSWMRVGEKETLDSNIQVHCCLCMAQEAINAEKLQAKRWISKSIKAYRTPSDTSTLTQVNFLEIILCQQHSEMPFPFFGEK